MRRQRSGWRLSQQELQNLARILKCEPTWAAVDRALSRLGLKRLLADLRRGVFAPKLARYVQRFVEDLAKVSLQRAAWVTALATVAAALFTLSNLKVVVTVVVIL